MPLTLLDVAALALIAFEVSRRLVGWHYARKEREWDAISDEIQLNWFRINALLDRVGDAGRGPRSRNEQQTGGVCQRRKSRDVRSLGRRTDAEEVIPRAVPPGDEGRLAYAEGTTVIPPRPFKSASPTLFRGGGDDA